MDLKDVICVGKLYMKSNRISEKAWVLREFALSGIKLSCFKDNVKKGEWIIGACVVEPITPEQAQQPSARFAFQLQGQKSRIILNAENEACRQKWIELLQKQIAEFKNPVRPLLRDQEVVHGKGLVDKKTGMMGSKKSFLLVVTNLPRIMEIDSTKMEIKEQFEWTASRVPVFTKEKPTKFKISVGGKELTYETSENGVKYWESLFQRLHRIELYNPSVRAPIVKIGGAQSNIRPNQSAELTPQEKAKRVSDLKYLVYGLSVVQALLLELDRTVQSISDFADVESKKNAKAYQKISDVLDHKLSHLFFLEEHVDFIESNLILLINTLKQRRRVVYDMGDVESVFYMSSVLLETFQGKQPLTAEVMASLMAVLSSYDEKARKNQNYEFVHFVTIDFWNHRVDDFPEQFVDPKPLIKEIESESVSVKAESVASPASKAKEVEEPIQSLQMDAQDFYVDDEDDVEVGELSKEVTFSFKGDATPDPLPEVPLSPKSPVSPTSPVAEETIEVPAEPVLSEAGEKRRATYRERRGQTPVSSDHSVEYVYYGLHRVARKKATV